MTHEPTLEEEFASLHRIDETPDDLAALHLIHHDGGHNERHDPACPDCQEEGIERAQQDAEDRLHDTLSELTHMAVDFHRERGAALRMQNPKLGISEAYKMSVLGISPTDLERPEPKILEVLRAMETLPLPEVLSLVIRAHNAFERGHFASMEVALWTMDETRRDPQGVHGMWGYGRCGICGESFHENTNRAEVVRKDEEGAPHLIVHDEPCAFTEGYELA